MHLTYNAIGSQYAVKQSLPLGGDLEGFYAFNAKERDEETGLYYYGMRYYAAWICRFVSVDPLQFKYPYYTPYQYAGNKPISFIDLDGAEPDKETGNISATIYYKFDTDTDATPENANREQVLSQQQKDNFIKALGQNIQGLNGIPIGNDQVMNVDNVVLKPMPDDMKVSDLKSYEFFITIGHGASADPDTIKGLSYVKMPLLGQPKEGYIYYSEKAEEGKHEFLHFLGLSDRYANVLIRDGKPIKHLYYYLNGGSIPLVIEGEKGYNPATNIMSNPTTGTTLSEQQINFIYNRQREKTYSSPAIIVTNLEALGDAVTVKGSGAKFIVNRTTLEKGGYKIGRTLNWAAMRKDMLKPVTTDTFQHKNNPANYENIRIRTR